MRQLVLGLLFCFSGTCLSSGCMKDFAAPEQYEGGSVIKIRKYLWGGSITVEDKTNNEWKLDGMVFDPATKTFKLEHAERAASASGPMESNVLAMQAINDSYAGRLEQSKIQAELTIGALREVRGGFVDGMTIGAQMMGLRNERSAAHDAASAANPDLLEQLVQQYLPHLTANPGGAGYNAELQAIKADQFVALAKARQMQAANPDDPTVASLVRSLDAALCKCASLKDARTTTDPLEVPGLP